MQNNSLELSFLSLIALISFFVFLIIQKLSHKISNGALLDDDFNKPQAFHSFPVSRCGGLSSFIVFLILSEYLLINKKMKKLIKAKIDKKLASIDSVPI